MDKSNQTQIPMRKALDGLLSVGTVRGVCLGRGGEVLVNRFPFSDRRLLSLCKEVERVLENFAEQGREVERMVFGFDGGHLVLQVDGDVRLLIMHLIPDEADFVAKAGQAFLADHRQEIVSVEAMPIELEIEPELEFDLDLDLEPVPDSEPPAEEEHAAPATATAVDSEGEEEKNSAAAAAAAKNIQPPDQETLQLVVSKPELEELPLDSSPPAENGATNSGFLALLEASREQKIDDAVLATGPEEALAEGRHVVAAKDEPSLADWAAEHLDLPEDGSRLPAAKAPRRSPVGRAVVGAVKVQPVRLAAQQPQSTLPPPKKPRVRRAKATVENS